MTYGEWSNTGVGENISRIDITINSKARVGFTTTQNIQANARIEKTRDIFVLAKADIKKTPLKTVLAKSRITVGGVVKIIQANANISVTTNKTIQVKGNILTYSYGEWSNTGTGENISRVAITVLSKANVKVDTIKTIQAKANIKATQEIYISAKAIIFQGGATKIITAKASIFKQQETVITAVASIRLTRTKTIQAKARISIYPSITTNAVTAIQLLQATGNGNITSLGGADSCSSRGFVWGTASKANPENTAPASSGYDDFVSEAGSFGLGAFAGLIDSLNTGQLYYIRAFAQNVSGYAYGAEVQFTTLAETSTSVLAKARLQVPVETTVQALSRIQSGGVAIINQAKANIKNTVVQSTTAKSAVLKTVTTTIEALGRIEIGDIGNVITAKANLKNTLDNTINAKASIKFIDTAYNITAKARIGLETAKTVDAIGNIFGTTVRTAAMKASIKHTALIHTAQAKAYLNVGTNKLLLAKADIKKAISETIQAKAWIVLSTIPVPVSPKNCIRTIDGQDYFIWETPTNVSGGTVHCRLQIASDSNFANIEVDIDTKNNGGQIQYDTGVAWSAYPTTGLPSVYQGNQARWLASFVTGENKYWRIAGGT